MTRKSVLTFGSLLALAPALAACGGATGAATAPLTPASIAPPASPPAPAPPPLINYDTPEYQRSNAVTKLNAISAYQAGATGAGITAAVIDSGVNASLAEFSGKMSAASADIAGTRGMGDEDDSLDQAQHLNVSGRFDVIMGSDVLYERDEIGHLPKFIDRHAKTHVEVLIVDPNRGNRTAFNRRMAHDGFALEEVDLSHDAREGEPAYKGRLLRFMREQTE